MRVHVDATSLEIRIVCLVQVIGAEIRNCSAKLSTFLIEARAKYCVDAKLLIDDAVDQVVTS